MLKGEKVALRRETLEQLELAVPSCPEIAFQAGRRAQCFTGKEIFDPSLLFFGTSDVRDVMNRAPLSNCKHTSNKWGGGILPPKRRLSAAFRPYRSLSGYFLYKSANSPAEGDKTRLRPLPEKEGAHPLFLRPCREKFSIPEINFFHINI
jgi:hypothetical protein